MGKIALDSSVIVGWLLDDGIRSGEEARLIQYLLQNDMTIMAPRYLLIEVTNSLYWKKCAKRDLLLMLNRVSDLDIQWVESEELEIKELAELVFRSRLTAYDAYYLLVSLVNKCKLVTHDKALLKADQKRCISPKMFLEQMEN